MNYYNFVNTILETAKSHKLVYEVGEGDIYEHLNSGDHKYPCVFLTVQNVDSNGSQMTVTGSLFYVDALLSDTSNKLQIQSTGMTTLQQIFMRLMDNYPDFDLRTGRYTPFDEKFSDLCAGVFSNFTISFMDDTCIFNDDIFEGDEPTPPTPPTPPGPEPPTPPTPPTPEGKYMTITVDGNAGETIIKPTVTGNLPTLNLQYRVNNGEWTDFIVGTTEDIHVVAGDLVQFKGVNESGISSESNYLKFAISGNPVALSGNVMSLIDGVGDAIVVPCDYCFYRLFHSSSIKTVSPDFLPATTLSDYCYYSMFDGCTSLTQAPELPATTLVTYCYSYMFADCTSLTTAPVLPATTLDFGCYWNMFLRCTSLTQSPELPATTLAQNCYYRMFRGCTSLTQAPELPATTLADKCYADMFYGCTSLSTAPALNATTLAKNCYSGMFGGCTSLTQAPELPAVTLHEYCYSSMFRECTSLTQAPELPATTLDFGCYLSMFEGCTSLNYVKCLSTDITATNALYNWLSGVASSGTFVKKYGVEYLIDSPSGIPQGWMVEEIDAPIPPEPEPKYMTITVDDAVGETVIKPTVTGSLPTLNLQYRINNGDWTDFIVGTTADIHLTAGDWVQFKGLNERGIADSTANYLNFAISGNPVALSGNVMSLIDGVGDALVIPCNYCFLSLFKGSSIKTVSSDFLPATTLAKSCYNSMFWKCTSLVKAPELPATTLANGCYAAMFYECSSLTKSPELHATTLAEICYRFMFRGCTSLVNAPELTATTLAEGCYSYMFYGCTSLTKAPELPSTTIVGHCYEDMFWGCTSLTTAPKLPATTLAEYCYAEMFYECKSLTKAPELPATTLADWCYFAMFGRCTSLVNAPALPATTLAESCYQAMFESCTSLTNAPVLPATTLANNCYVFMFRYCSKLNYVKCLLRYNNTNAQDDWLYRVASKGTFVKPYSVSYSTGASGIPSGWTIQNI